ncbi:MAG TPA: HAD-IB family phosphatase [Methylococcaceae bacterium]|nr:HAD-IB family phosphatase [Methylococcaceae bacterium]
MSGPPYAAILFDCDSTLSAIEGIDELARQAGLYEQLAPLTAAAMEGTLSLEAVYRKRLDAIRPTREAVEALGECYFRHAVPGAKEVIAELQKRGKRVHIVSGGLRQALLPLAARLGVGAEQVHAVDVFFDEVGNYRDFDESSPLARGGGKTVVCCRVRETEGPVVLVGDGMTDFEVTEAGVDFIGFGGVAKRESVRSHARRYIDEATLLPLLDWVLTREERA